MISQHAFSYSSIEQITIPIKITEICRESFAYGTKLGKIEIPSNSQLHSIDIDDFNQCPIESISIPPHVRTITKKSYVIGFDNFLLVEIDENSEIQSLHTRFINEKATLLIPVNIIHIIH